MPSNLTHLATAMLLLPAGLLGVGCGEDYAQQRMDEQSEAFRQVQGMTRGARQDGLEQTLATTAAPGLSAPQRQALAATLRQIIQAEDARVLRVDAFGPEVYRATFELTTDAGRKETAVLLVAPDDDGKLYWAGKN